MGKVVSGLTMSLDGYIAGPNDGPEHPLGENGMQLFDWYESGDTEYTVPSGTMAFHISAESAQMLDETFSAIGALVTGRRTFDITDGWGGQHPVDAPIFVVTHEVPHEWIERYPDAPFTFVTDGIESAVAQAQAVAGDRDVAVGAASLVQQALKAGLLDEMHVSLVPLLLGGGVRLFEDFGSEPVKMEITRVINDPDVTQITYRVVK
ncbi:MAG TPA: dihydrofolate reductase family protein [Aggregatilineales bacterium]|nr:dihydrofolate reductase family protein [Aggregatilineales bacterium]